MSELVDEAMEAIAQPKTTNMTPQKRKLNAMVAVIKETPAYKVGNIDYKIESEPNGNTKLFVWSPKALYGAFGHPELATIAEIMSISAFIYVDNGRAKLIIY